MRLLRACLIPLALWALTLSLSAQSSADSVPEVVILDQLESIFEPVIFQHKLHSEMATMGRGCEICHHNNPGEKIQPCHDCHTTDAERHDLNQPTLNGAYHRQCLSCHKEWESREVCETCHARKAELSPEASQPKVDKTDIIGVQHPTILVPEKRVFNTGYKPGRVVTFHHREHVELYRLGCVDCHHKENCSTCHEGIQKIAPLKKTLAVHHEPCSGCHETQPAEGCGFCHQQQETPGFSHALTGLVLSDSHVDFECNECHVDERYDQPPRCAGCHADVVYPDDLPGEPVK